MTEEKLVLAYKPIIENLSKNRFNILLTTTKFIVFKNNGIINIYEAQERYEKIKLKLAKGKKIKEKDMCFEDVLKLQQSYGSAKDLDKILIRRYDFILELFTCFNETTFDITDIKKIIENADEVYIEHFKERFEKYALESIKQKSKHLLAN